MSTNHLLLVGSLSKDHLHRFVNQLLNFTIIARSGKILEVIIMKYQVRDTVFLVVQSLLQDFAKVCTHKQIDLNRVLILKDYKLPTI